jgi:hypothetical protein
MNTRALTSDEVVAREYAEAVLDKPDTRRQLAALPYTGATPMVLVVVRDIDTSEVALTATVTTIEACVASLIHQGKRRDAERIRGWYAAKPCALGVGVYLRPGQSGLTLSLAALPPLHGAP